MAKPGQAFKKRWRSKRQHGESLRAYARRTASCGDDSAARWMGEKGMTPAQDEAGPYGR